MTINAQIAYIKSHPFYKLALTDESAMEMLLFEVIFHTYTVASGNCARAYRQSRRMNGPQIVEAIRDCPPPCNLDVRLPIPNVEECVVVSLPGTVGTKNAASISVAAQELGLGELKG